MGRRHATDDIHYEVRRASSLAMPCFRRRNCISGVDHRLDPVLQPMLIHEIWDRIYESDHTLIGVNASLRRDRLLPKGIAKRLAASFVLWYTTHIVCDGGRGGI